MLLELFLEEHSPPALLFEKTSALLLLELPDALALAGPLELDGLKLFLRLWPCESVGVAIPLSGVELRDKARLWRECEVERVLRRGRPS